MIKDFSENGKYFIKDSVLSNQSQDEFNHEDIAMNLKNIIDLNEAPFSIAITGEWGLGKSSVVELLKDICKSSRNSNDYKFCEINAWKYEKEAIRKSFLKNIYIELDGKKTSKWDELIDAIRNSVQSQEEEKVSFFKKISNIFKASCKIFTQVIFYAIGIEILISVFWNDIEQFNIKDNFWIRILFPILSSIMISTIQLFSNIFKNKTFVRVIPPIETTDEFEELFLKRKNELTDKNKNLKIIVIVDDLDRLCPQKMVEALDAIKAFEGCIFIVPFDEQILKNALEDKKVNLSNSEYLTITGELFFEKMFQFKIPLNPIIEIDIRKHAKDLIVYETPDLYLLIGEENLNNVLDILIHTGVSNPRKLKKIINMFANNILLVKRREITEKLNEGLLSDEEGIKLIAKLSVLQADFSEFYKILSNSYDYIDVFLNIVNGVENNNGEDEKIDVEKLMLSVSAQFFNFKNSLKTEVVNIELKKEYMHLYNFLNATNDISLEKINYFVFMAQSSDSYAMGDKITREIIEAITSNSVLVVKNIFTVRRENIDAIETLIINSLSSNMVRYRIVNTIYCLVNSLSEYNSVNYINIVGEQVKKLLAANRLNPIRFNLKCISFAIKETNNDGYFILIENILSNLINEDIKYLNIDGKEMNSDKVKEYIINLLQYLINIYEEINDIIKNQCKDFSGKILEDKNKFITSKQFLDEYILENGGSECLFIDKNILLKVLIQVIINEKNNSKSYYSILIELLEHFSSKDKIKVSNALYDLINNEIVDIDILGAVLKYKACITKEHSNHIIESISKLEIYKQKEYVDAVIEIISDLKWSKELAKIIDIILTYIHKEFGVDISKGLLKVVNNDCLNDMTTFSSTYFSNLILLEQFFNISDKLYKAYNATNRVTFLNSFLTYIRDTQSITKEYSLGIQQISNALIKEDEPRTKIIDILIPTMSLWNQYHTNYREWVNMNLHIFELYSEYFSIDDVENFVKYIDSFTSLVTEEIDSITKTFAEIYDRASNNSKIIMFNFVIKNCDNLTDLSSGIKIVRNSLLDEDIKSKINLISDSFMKIVETIADKNFKEILKLIIDCNIPTSINTLGIFIDKLLMDNNYNDDNKELLLVLLSKEFSNSDVEIKVIESILKKTNGTRIDAFVLQMLKSPTEQEYKLFKDILYVEKVRSPLEVYNILNLAKAFENFFNNKIKCDLICKVLSHTENSYELILSRIENMYGSIISHRSFKKTIANELALMLKRLENDDENKTIIISFVKRNGLLVSVKNAGKEYDINI